MTPSLLCRCILVVLCLSVLAPLTYGTVYNTGSYILYGDANCQQEFSSGSVSLPIFTEAGGTNSTQSNCFAFNPENPPDEISGIMSCGISEQGASLATFNDAYCGSVNLAFNSPTIDGSICLVQVGLSAKISCTNTASNKTTNSAVSIMASCCILALLATFLVTAVGGLCF